MPEEKEEDNKKQKCEGKTFRKFHQKTFLRIEMSCELLFLLRKCILETSSNVSVCWLHENTFSFFFFALEDGKFDGR